MEQKVVLRRWKTQSLCHIQTVKDLAGIEKTAKQDAPLGLRSIRTNKRTSGLKTLKSSREASTTGYA
ncbi:uncharacterized protein LAJ45_09092 [Morchella importuna]|uniref:uncharacterized protein n=1 Tax=Morchella importuna TaxID=1174673 RepID=UPI001E8E1053|nr:uncharacterized protein LAJ45_09092 [Morchella importuna]KAH8146718.1 hypothetical protein LAJ45_09092 [Morchella importuna]